MALPSATEPNGNGVHGNGVHGNGVHGKSTNGHNGAAPNGSNGVNGKAASPPKLTYDPTFTDKVIAATGPNAHPRLAQIMPALLRHLHDFAREVNLTVAEWTAGVDLINECGAMSTDRRNETQLLCDILGLESLVDETTSQLLAANNTTLTSSAILGPFYRHDAPFLPYGASIVHDLSPSLPWYAQALADSAFVSGRVLRAAPSPSSSPPSPLPGAVVDVWHSAPNGLYEQQDAAQGDMNLRGRFRTDARGRFAFYALRPAPYPIPSDGPAGRFLRLLDRHPWRPAHMHFIVSAEGCTPLTTQVFDSRDRYITNDSVFAVKDDLVVDFVPREGDAQARWSLEYDFVLGPGGA